MGNYSTKYIFVVNEYARDCDCLIGDRDTIYEVDCYPEELYKKYIEIYEKSYKDLNTDPEYENDFGVNKIGLEDYLKTKTFEELKNLVNFIQVYNNVSEIVNVRSL